MTRIPEITTQSNTKRTQYQRFTAQIPQNIEINFSDKNKNGRLDPTEWIEYKQNGQRIVGYSPFGNQKKSDTPAKIASKLGVSEAEIKAQTGEKVNPNSFFRFVLPQKAKAAEKTSGTKPPQAETKIPAQKTPTAVVVNKTQTPKTPSIPEPSFKDGQKVGKFEQKTHNVKKYENLYDLSIKLNTTEEELRKLNGLKTDTLQIGQELKYYSNRERYGFNTNIPDAVHKEALKNKLEGVFVGKEDVILKAAKDNNIPVSTLYAIMTQETGHGTSAMVKNPKDDPMGKNNPGGIKTENGKDHRTFDTLDDGIKTMAKILGSYHRRGLDTLPEIRKRYSEDSVNWVKNTTRFQNSFCDALTAAEKKSKAAKIKISKKQ